ncbi:UPF0039 protein [Gordonia spumicola]|uniref:UPF0039 protein n=1 Tax=Gordonia spumicola TaxID=589161 RepID=A0A7I9VD47_9ACTN|nr:UPF0039 protein [Gordonia spumicola]
MADLDPVTLYGILRLRVDVFVVEQECAYPELDGRDAEPATLHYWCVDESGTPIATARLLTDEFELRIGRVCVHGDHRGEGVTRVLLDRIVADIGDRTSVLDAQAHLEQMYARWGYTAYGPEFVEDGIPHIPMRR